MEFLMKLQLNMITLTKDVVEADLASKIKNNLN